MLLSKVSVVLVLFINGLHGFAYAQCDPIDEDDIKAGTVFTAAIEVDGETLERSLELNEVLPPNSVGICHFTGTATLEWADDRNYKATCVFIGNYNRNPYVIDGECRQHIVFKSSGYKAENNASLTFPRLEGYLYRRPTDTDIVVAVLTTQDPLDGGATSETEYEPE